MGYGADASRGEYLLVQNSWGESYVRGDLSNEYVGGLGKTSYVKICTAVAGKGKLEIINRIGYEIRDLVISDLGAGKATEVIYELDKPLTYTER